MKKIFGLISMLAAMHFLVIVVGAVYLVGTGRLNKDSSALIRSALFPEPTTKPATTQPAAEETTTPDSPQLRLEALLAKQASKPATDQVEFVRAHFENQFAQLDRRQRDLKALQDQVEAARFALEREKKDLTSREVGQTQREAQAAQADQDKGFQSEIALYTAMPPAQVKKVLLGMDDAQAAKYLQALPPRTATKILKEFKSPEETSRMTAIFDTIRKAEGVPASPEASAEKTAGNVAGSAAEKKAGTPPVANGPAALPKSSDGPTAGR